MRTLPAAVLLALVAAPPVAAGPDPEAATPYRWRVAVRFDPHPLFTPAFRAQVVADTAAALGPVAGQVGTVEVVDLAGPSGQDPALAPLDAAVRAGGWAALDDPKFRTLSGVKVHLVRVTLAGGTAAVSARQLDGSTGLTTPAVRTQAAADLTTVGRVAGLVVGREFGPVGTLDLPEGAAAGGAVEAVTVRFRGGQLPGFDRLVKRGDVFSVAAVIKPKPADPGTVGKPREYTLLRAETDAAGGACRCRVLTRFAAPFPPGRAVVGYRCLKLATVEDRVQVKVVDLAGRPAAAGVPVQVRASDIDFLPRTDARDRLDQRGGVFQTAARLRGVACLVVSLGDKREERYPVPVTGSGPVVVRFQMDAAAARRAEFGQQLDDFRGRTDDARNTLKALRDDLFKLINSGKNKDALARATAGLEALDGADKALADELARLTASAAGLDKAAADEAAAAAAPLAILKAGRTEVATKAEDLAEVVKKSADPARFEKEFRVKELKARIRAVTDAGDGAEALALYDQLTELTRDARDREQRLKLAAEWEPKTDAQKAAREFVGTAFKKVTELAEFEVAQKSLTAAAAELAKADDRLGLRGLLAALDAAYLRLKDVLDRVDKTGGADQATVAKLKAVTEALRAVEKGARAKLAAIEGAGRP